MGDFLIMNKKERQRKAVLEQLLTGSINRQDAARRLCVSKRQLIRIIQRYQQQGDRGLTHRHRGKPSGRVYAIELKEKILSRYEERYFGFGPTLAAEKLLEEDQLPVQAETLRLWLKAAGLWSPRRQRKVHRIRRARRTRFGELLQLDGSIHDWFEGVDEKQCLMNIVDDATGKTLALMDEGETTRAAFALLQWWIRDAGIPMAIYVDLKSLYVSPRSLYRDEEGELVEPEWLTHFSKACKKLGIEIIKAYSPQAKGRVERSHAVYQDRFRKELKLKGIKDIEQANQLLSGGFVNQLNKKFAKPAHSDQDAHVPLNAKDDLNQVLCWEFTRQIKNDWTISFCNQFYQIKKTKSYSVRPRQKIQVREHLDGSISLWCKEQRLSHCLITQEQLAQRKQGIKRTEPLPNKDKPGPHNTPWRQFNPNWLKPKNKSHRITTACV